jgi:hypothetical protein
LHATRLEQKENIDKRVGNSDQVGAQAACRQEAKPLNAKQKPFSIFEENMEMVELSGVEPLTSCMPCKRSTS